jgi:hypothetical protein
MLIGYLGLNLEIVIMFLASSNQRMVVFATSLQIWSRQDDAHGTTWVDPVTYNLQNLLQLEQPPPCWEPKIVCYCEDAHAIFIRGA